MAHPKFTNNPSLNAYNLQNLSTVHLTFFSKMLLLLSSKIACSCPLHSTHQNMPFVINRTLNIRSPAPVVCIFVFENTERKGVYSDSFPNYNERNMWQVVP